MKKVVVSLLVAAIVGTGLFFMFNRTDEGDQTFEQELRTIAGDTYQFLKDYTDPNTGLTMDRVDFENGERLYEQTSPTNIGMYLASTISAAEMGMITKDEAKKQIQTTLTTLEAMESWHGLYYNWYYVADGSLMKDWGQFISTVDNGWLTSALVIVGQYFPELSEMTDQLVAQMDYSKLYDEQVGQFRGGYDAEQGKLTDHHYGLLYSETRITSYTAIGKGDVPTDHWWRLFRTFPPKDDWQAQKPEGERVTYDSIELYQGHYNYEDIKFVPSWGGSMFEGLMPPLFIKEKELGTKALGLNNKRYVEGQIKYAADNNYGAWGFSPAAIINGYSEFGVPDLAIEGYDDQATVTAHASFLALDYAPEAVRENINNLRALDMYGEYGFYDTINLTTDQVAKSYLSLDQGMIMVAIANYLHDGVIREYFHKDPIGEKPEYLLSEEDFLIED